MLFHSLLFICTSQKNKKLRKLHYLLLNNLKSYSCIEKKNLKELIRKIINLSNVVYADNKMINFSL